MAAAQTFVIVEQSVGSRDPAAVARAHQPTRR